MLPPILVTSPDTERLSRLLDVLPEQHDAARALDAELACATVVASAASWDLPSGKTGHYRVLGIVYQPEASGDFHL